MSSTIDANHQGTKKKKDRACDACRRRKTKCDGPLKLNSICTNCVQTRKPCTYVEVSKPRGPPKAYVTNLEDRMEALEALLERVRPGIDFSGQLGPRVVRDSWKNERSASTTTLSLHPSAQTPLSASTELLPNLVSYDNNEQSQSKPSTSQSPLSNHLKFSSHGRRSQTDTHGSMFYRDSEEMSDDESTTETSSSSSDTEEVVVTSIIGRTKITLRASEDDDITTDNNIRFHGRSSTAGLVEATRQFKHMHLKENLTASVSPDNVTVAQTRRPEFWKTPPWETITDGAVNDNPEVFLTFFPPPNLAENLINLYFKHSNSIFPLLHRPTFNRQWNERLHHRNIWFCCTCAAIFAIASRWCFDERVLPREAFGGEGKPDWRKAGQTYFQIALDIHQTRKSVFHSASLFEVQTFTLMALYLSGTYAYPTAWLVVSAGIRRAQDVGAHRKKVYSSNVENNVDNELWKRAFWHLVVLDRLEGAHLGRACGLAEEDFDLELPLEVDDEYWNIHQDVKEQFKQPVEIPSVITAFNEYIKVTQILAFAIRTLYATENQSRFFRRLIPVEKDSLIKQLTISLDDWKERLPNHLQLGKDLGKSLFANQSSILHSTYYLARILIYRTLIPTSLANFVNGSNPLYPSRSIPFGMNTSIPAITVCTDAAKSCVQIIKLQLQHGTENFYVLGIINIAFLCAAFLSADIWNLKLQQNTLNANIDLKPPLAQQIEDDVSATKMCLDALEAAKSRWDVVTPLLRILTVLCDFTEPQCASQNPYPDHISPKVDLNLSQTASQWSSIRSDDGHNVRQRQHIPLSMSKEVLESHTPISVDPPFRDGYSISELRNMRTSESSIRDLAPQSRFGSEHRPSSEKLHSSYEMYSVQSALSPSGRARAISFSNESHWRERTLPFISSSMRRTSSPNLSLKMAQYPEQEHPHITKRYVETLHSFAIQSDSSMRFDDVNMRYEQDVHPSVTSRYLQTAITPKHGVHRLTGDKRDYR